MGILNWLLGHGPAESEEPGPRVAKAIEVAVHGTDSRLRLVSDYERRLTPAVEAALAFCDGIAQTLPGPLDLSPQGWGADPEVRALFARSEDIRELLQRSPELHAFTANPNHAEVDPVYGVLAMKLTERVILGGAIEGDIVRTDVPRRTVSFSDHRLAAFCASEEELRREIERRAYEHLVVEALTHLTRIERQERLHEGEHRLLEARLQLLHGTRAGLSALEAPAEADENRFQQLRQGLVDNSSHLAALRARVGTLEDRLERVAEVLTKPGAVMQVTPTALRLTALNQVVDATADAAAEVRLAEIAVSAPNPLVRETVIVRIPRGDITARTMDFEAAERWLR